MATRTTPGDDIKAPAASTMTDELWNETYGGKTRYFKNYLDKVDITTKKTLREIVEEKSEKLGVDPNYLYNTLIAEGLDHYKGFSNSKNLSTYDEEVADYLRQGNGLDAFTLVGLDTIGNVKEELFKKGYLDREEYKNKVEEQTRENEKDESVKTGHYSDLDYLVENVAAYLKNDEDKIEDYIKKEGINFTPLQKKFFQSVAYNSGMGNARKMIKSYEDKGFLEDDKFIFEKPNEYWSVPYKNARRRMSGIMGMGDEKVFKTNEDLTAVLNNPSDKIKYKSRSRREAVEPVSTLTQEGIQKGEMLRDVDLRKEAEVVSTLEPQTPETASLNNIEIQNLSAMGVPERSVLEREPQEPQPLRIPQQEFADLQESRKYYEEPVARVEMQPVAEQQIPEVDVPTAVENTRPTQQDVSFGEAFNRARQELGDGQVFEWRGKKYTTDLKEYQTGGKVNNTGYTKGSKTENNPYNIIPSNKITMKKVEGTVMALKLDENGLPIGMEFMKPGKEYDFEDAESVMEIPKYQVAGWANPAKPPYWMQGTGINILGNNPPTTPTSQPFQYGEPGTEQTLDEFGNPISVPTRYGPHTAQEQANMQQAYAQTFNPTQLLGDVPRAPTVDDSAESEVPIVTLDDVEYDTRPKATIANELNPASPTQQRIEDLPVQGFQPEDKKIGEEDLKMRERPSIQFFNPYGGTDIPGAAVGLGASIENKSALGIAGNAAKLVTGLGRNVVGGIGTQRANNRAMDEYYKNLRKGLDGPMKYQQGGENRDLEINHIPGVYGMQGGDELQGITPRDLRILEMEENERLRDNLSHERRQLMTGAKPNMQQGTNLQSMTPEDLQILKMEENARLGDNLSHERRQLMSKPKVDMQQGFYMQKGGQISKEQLLTGEYLQGVDQDMPEQMTMVDGEVEAGEYYQTNQGDIAEVVGNKHSGEGEKVPMEEGDRVLTDHTKLGAKNAKDIRDNYDIKVRAKDTYSKVLDKFRSKIGLDKLVKEEEQILKKIEEQDKEDLSDTAGINMHFLENKLAEIRQKKEPIEQVRKILYDKLFSMQEADKPKEKQEENKFQVGGQNRERFNAWYENARSHGFDGGVDLDAEDLGAEAGKIQQWMVANKPQEVIKYFRSGQPMTSKGIDILKEKVPKLFSSTGMPIDKPSGQWTPEERAQLYSAIQGTDLDTDEFWLEQFHDNRWDYRGPLIGTGTNTLSQTEITGLDMQATPDIEYRPQETQTELSADPEKKERENKKVKGDTQKKGLNVMNLPDQYPMMPGAMEPHLKDQRRFDRINPIKVDVEPYLERIYEQQNVANAQTEGYSPAVQAALNANTQAETQKALTDLGMKVDAQNLGIQYKTDVQNAQTQRMEENARLQDNLSYEQRQLMAKAKTDEEYKNYFDKNQEVNLRNYATINAMNNANARYSDIQFDGTGYQVAPNPYSGDIMRQKIDELMAAERERKQKEAEKTRTA